MTFEQITKLAEAFYSADTTNAVAKEVDYMVDAARVNADDTCVREKSRPLAEYDRVAMDSLEQACAYAEEHQAAAVAWFVANGVRF